MAVLQGEQARQVMARMQWRASQVEAESASARTPVTGEVPVRPGDDAKRPCA